MTIPSVSTNALGYGAFLGLYANLRYQLICGFDRAMINHFDVITVALCFSTALRSVTFTAKQSFIYEPFTLLVHTYVVKLSFSLAYGRNFLFSFSQFMKIDKALAALSN